MPPVRTNIAMTASGDHTTTTTAEAGGSGDSGTGVGGAVATSVVNNQTLAGRDGGAVDARGLADGDGKPSRFN